MMKELSASQLSHVTGGELENFGSCHCICKPTPKPIEPQKVVM